MPVDVPSPAAVRREREREARREAMLGAARAVFAEKGYEGATLDEVAERAGFGKGTLYNYFPGGKEEILFALMDDVFGSLTTLSEQHFAATADRPARTSFEAYIAMLIHHFTDGHEVFQLFMKEGQRMLLEQAPRLAAIHRRRDDAMGVVTQAVQRAMDRGELRPLHAEAVAELLMSNVKGYLMYSLSPLCEAEPMGPPFDTPEGAASFLASVLFDGLCIRPDSTL